MKTKNKSTASKDWDTPSDYEVIDKDDIELYAEDFWNKLTKVINNNHNKFTNRNKDEQHY